MKYIEILEGQSPVRVRMFVIADPPGWFNVIWNIMKGKLASDFRKVVHNIFHTGITVNS